MTRKQATIAVGSGLNNDQQYGCVVPPIYLSSTYNFEDEHIHILFKNGDVKDITEVDNAMINQNLMNKVKKYYICYAR